MDLEKPSKLLCYAVVLCFIQRNVKELQMLKVDGGLCRLVKPKENIRRGLISRGRIFSRRRSAGAGAGGLQGSGWLQGGPGEERPEALYSADVLSYAPKAGAFETNTYLVLLT